jgi:hypothetical protein|tara:strand:- start:18 stop:218 length:201 start_codon:yes stop_codon:yes gene_type:complete
MSTLQSLSNHLKHLEDIHRELDEKITRHWEHHDSDDKVRQEKLEKLSLKREIEALKMRIKEKGNED